MALLLDFQLKHSCVSGGDLVGDLTKIPLASTPGEFDIKLLPCKPTPASSGLSSSCAIQVAHIYVLLVLHTLPQPTPHPYKQWKILPVVRVLRRIFFIRLWFQLLQIEGDPPGLKDSGDSVYVEIT